jgi:DUF4097 and DUF4098 domain-containing protein YvlB
MDLDMTDVPQTPGSLKGITRIRLDCQEIDFQIEADSGLTDTVQLLVESKNNAPTVDTTGDELTILQNGRFRSGQFPAVLRVPMTGCPPVFGRVEKGDLSISGVNADVSIRVGSGDIRMGAGTGAFEIHTGKGDIHCAGHTGDIAIKSGAGDVHVSRSHGGVEVSLGKGDIHLEADAGNVAVKLGAGDVVSVDCSGALSVKLGAGDVIVNRPRAQILTVKNGSGDVMIKSGTIAGLGIQLAKGDIVSTAQIQHVVSSTRTDTANRAEQRESGEESAVTRVLRTHGMDFEAGDHGVRFALPGFEFEASDAGVRISKGGSSFTAGDDGVRITLGDSAAPGTFNAETAKGDISMDIPIGAPVRVEALVNGGTVRSDIPLVSVGRPGPRGTVQRFVGVSDPNAEDRINVRVKTDRGDIRLRSTAKAPEAPAPPATPVPAQPPKPFSPFSPDADTQRSPIVTREQRMRAILDNLSRGAITIEEADMQLNALEDE